MEKFTIKKFETNWQLATGNWKLGFTLIELLVVISIIGILTGIALVALGGARAGGRDARRRADLEQIRSGLELFRADCGKYPASLSGTSLTGDGSSTSCAVANVYIGALPKDPQPTLYTYSYTVSATTYALCSFLETGTTSASGCPNCGAGTSSVPCKYGVGPP